MSDDSGSKVSVFKAPPITERRTVSLKAERNISHLNSIPDDLVRDEFLNSLIAEGLPKNYNFEVHKTIWKIQHTNAQIVLLQFPEGLIRFGPVLADIMTAYFREVLNITIRFVIMGDLTYGACCIDDYLASSMGCDLIVHYAHSCLIPISQLNTNVKYLYIFLDIKFDLEHIVKCIIHNFHKKHIALASTIQFVASVHEIAKQLRDCEVMTTLPQSRPLTSGEVLGCTAQNLSKINSVRPIDSIIFICDGRFHLEALMIANPDLPAYRYDPYSRKLTKESYNFNEMFKLRTSAIEEAIFQIRRGGTFGIVLGTLGRQGNESVYNRLVERLTLTHSNCKIVKVMLPEVTQENLEIIEGIDVWVQIACPRLSIDWGSFFKVPLLNPFELAQSINSFNYNLFTGISLNDHYPVKWGKKEYPMDFYETKSCGDHTPNHSCSKESCECIRRLE